MYNKTVKPKKGLYDKSNELINNNRRIVDNSYAIDLSTGKYKPREIRNMDSFNKRGFRKIYKPKNLYTFKDYYTLYSGKPRFAHMTDEMKQQEVERTLKTMGNSAYIGAAAGLAAAFLTGIKAATG